MAQRFARDPALYGTGYPVIGANSIAFAVADAVYINSSGFLDTVVAAPDTVVLGYSLEDVTMASTNQTVAKVCPKYVAVQGVEMIYPLSAAGGQQTNIGEYAVFAAVTSGAMTLNQSTAGLSGTFLVIGNDPDGDGTTSDFVVVAARRQDRSGN